MKTKTALIIGSTGLVGEHCLQELLASPHYDKVIALVRKDPGITNPKLKTIVADFDKLDTLATEIKADDVFNTMGTTIAKAGSQEAFKKVDVDIPLAVAKIAKANGAKRFLSVSSLSANPKSPVFYSRMKGVLEEELKKVGFESLVIFRPSLLMGNRKEKRVGEGIAQSVYSAFSFVFVGAIKKYKGTPADSLAEVMVALANDGKTGVRIIENDEILEIAEK